MILPGVIAAGRRLAAGGGGGGVGPVILSVTVGQTSGTMSAVPVVLPTVDAGDLLICVYGNMRPRPFGTAPGWTNALAETSASACMAEAWRIANGTESGSIVNFPFSGTVPSGIAALIRIQAGTFNAVSPIQSAGGVSGASLFPDPPSLSPSWGSGNTRWFAAAMVSHFTGQGASTWPYPESNTDAFSGTTGVSVPQLLLCSQGINAGAQDPAAFGINVSSNWLAHTFAVQGV